MKLLCLDGGGVFGFVQAKVLQDANCYDKFDCLVGTSIGSTIAAAIAFDRQGQVGQDFFDEWMPKIFNYSTIRRLNPFIPLYSDKNLNEALKTIFSGDVFGNAKKPLFVTAANLAACKLKVFNSLDAQDAGLQTWQVLRSAVAGETYFDPWSGYGDGGVFANNPSMVGIAAAINVLKVPINQIEVLSIGTGDRSSPSGQIPSSLLTWAGWLADALLTGAANSMHDYFVRSVGVKRYVRIQFPGEPGWKLDNVKGMKEAEQWWKPDIANAVIQVRDF